MGSVMRSSARLTLRWDLAGKAANVPIHQLMGTYRESVPAYASSAVFESIEEYANEAVRYKEAGWQATNTSACNSRSGYQNLRSGACRR